METPTIATTTAGITPKQGWSWGGFAFNASFLIGVRKYRYLWWLLLALVPLVNIVFWIVYLIYLGVKGHVIGANGAAFHSQAEYDGYMNAQDHAGKVIFFAMLILIGIAIIGSVILAAIGLHYQSPVPQVPGGSFPSSY